MKTLSCLWNFPSLKGLNLELLGIKNSGKFSSVHDKYSLSMKIPLCLWNLWNILSINFFYIKFSLSGCLFDYLYPINVKTAEPIGPNLCVGPHVTSGKVYEIRKLFLYFTKRRCSQIKPQLKVEIEYGHEARRPKSLVFYKMSYIWNFLSIKCPIYKMSSIKCSIYKMFYL